MIYKLLTPEQWAQLRAQSRFTGSPVDLRDGFIHFSTAGQVVETAAKHFPDGPEVVLAEVDPKKLPAPVKWEASRGGQLFPHLYGELPGAAVARHWPLSRGEDGRLRFPELAGIKAPDWPAWKPTERASLCFIIEQGRILLIHKKRGLGAGKVNGPGGRLEPGETPEQSAIRETQEEVGVTPTGLVLAGELRFQFVDGYALQCSVFTASGLSGSLIETDEAKPFWCPVAEIPFENMWTDDRHWVPWMLEGRTFVGRFHFDGEAMLSGRVEPL